MVGSVSNRASAPAARYHVVAPLAEGGMGEVLLALRTDGRFRRLYALKRLRPALRDDPACRAMFLDEARLAGLVRHPNVVSVLDVGDDPDDPYLVMDFIDGVSASLVLRRAAARQDALPVQLAARITAQAAEGLHAVHELTDHDGHPLHMIHRDISPQNILLGFDGVARITDFGIAKALGRAAKTSTGLLKGKTGYMSPEQLQFEELDRRSDLFSLGVVLYELLATRRLYESTDPTRTARRILREPPPDIDDVRRDVHPALVQLLFELLAKDRTRRPADARSVAQRLDELVRTLELEEGQVTLRDYLATHFEDLRAHNEAERRQLVSQVEAQLSRPARGRSRKASTWAMVVLGGAVLGAGAFAAGLAGDGAAPERDGRAPATPPASVAGPPDETSNAVPAAANEGAPAPQPAHGQPARSDAGRAANATAGTDPAAESPQDAADDAERRRAERRWRELRRRRRQQRNAARRPARAEPSRDEASPGSGSGSEGAPRTWDWQE